jgi:hypothetical protein
MYYNNLQNKYNKIVNDGNKKVKFSQKAIFMSPNVQRPLGRNNYHSIMKCNSTFNKYNDENKYNPIRISKV